MATSEAQQSKDPWDWTVDEVVAALCDPALPFRAGKNLQALPDAILLEEKLREHFIEGFALLTELDHSTLKAEFAIPAVGQRSHIKHEIQRLRRQSPRYLAFIKDCVPDPPQGFSIARCKAKESPEAQQSIKSDKPSDEQVQPQQNETTIIDEHGKKRRRLVLNVASPIVMQDEMNQAAADTTMHERSNTLVPTVVAEQPVPFDHGNMTDRKRIAPTLIHQPDERHESPQTLDSQHSEGAGHLQTNGDLQISHARKPNEAYLGIRALSVDDLFYERVQPASQLAKSLVTLTTLNEDEGGSLEFAFVGTPMSNGQQRYINSRIQHFLRQQRQIFRRGTNFRYGILPYPDALASKHQSLSITVFEATPNAVIATRQDRTKWRPSSSTNSARTNLILDDADADVYHLPIPLETDDGADWDYLEKWHHIGNHDVLPGYGDSGSEGEYELETWRQIEKENGKKLPRPLGRSKKIKKVSKEDVLSTIEKAIQQMIDDWEQKQLPRLSRTAWMLWSKSRRKGTKQTQINSLTFDVEHLSSRLDKLRKEIAKEEWISTAKILRQCESMRRTIFELEECNWKISILQLKVRPEKPEKLQQPPKAPSGNTHGPELSHEKQILDDDTSLTATSDDDLDGFIVDDEDFPRPSDSGMANAESDDDEDKDDDRTISDGGSSTGTPDMHERGPRVDAGKANPIEVALRNPEQEAPSQPTFRPPSLAEIIDLTSDASEPEVAPLSSTSAVYPSRTPSVHRLSALDEDPFARSQRKKAAFKLPQGLPTFGSGMSNVVDLDEDSAYDSAPEPTIPLKLPGLHEIVEISEMDPKILMERSDRKRLLIWILTRCDLKRRSNAYTYISNHDLHSVQAGVWCTIKSLRGFRRKVIGSESERESETIKAISAWFISWTNVALIKGKHGAKEHQLYTAEADQEGFEPFYNYLHELRCLGDFGEADETTEGMALDSGTISVPTTPTKSGTTPQKPKRALIEYSDNDLQPPSSKKKRKYVVAENKEAADLRKKAHERVQEREKRQHSLKKRLEKMGQTEEDPSQVAVNLGKLDEQGLVYLPASIGARIQPHQKDGIRFLWREIIEDHTSKQGCLLAQTMGLGKTMQVISFLITVAQAAQSSDSDLRHQIPPRLRESRTLVLCPPSLIDNWYEEFLIWAPDNMTETIGEIRKVSASASTAPYERLQTIQEWGDEGGILILGFSVLRELINNPVRRKTGQTLLDDDQYRTITDILLNQPNIVVADEAHAAKNRQSKLHQILLRFRTGSRIALTGSPLSNNLSEYYALIEWVAPGYLGEHREFVAHYEEPIQEGLYRDSPISKWRIGLKKLEVFKREVQPKVHRADVSVLASRLKGKSEFVIKLALTPLQETIYQNFVDSMGKQYGTEGPGQAKLWAWISILRLVCNHPKCFFDRLNSKGGTMKRPRKGRSAVAEELGIADEDEAFMDASPLALGLSEDLVQRQLQPFQSLEAPLDSVSLAFKMTILVQILELSEVAGDKVLVFTHSLPTLNYVEHLISTRLYKYQRLDGRVATTDRQQMTKDFNEGDVNILLTSTRAGGTGLNLYGANRVVIVDDHFNPTWEEQAIGRAYRIGQTKHVFVYRLTVGGTFEEALHNQSLFKQQLATRAVDKRNIARQATRGAKDYFQPLKTVEQTDIEPMRGKDPAVLDKILAAQTDKPFIRAIVPCETFHQEVEEKLTAEEQKEVEQEEELSRLRRTDPAAYQAKLMMARAALPNPTALPVYSNGPKPLIEGVGVPKTTGTVNKLALKGIHVSTSQQPPNPGQVSFVGKEPSHGFPRPYASVPAQQQPVTYDSNTRAVSEPSSTPSEPVSAPQDSLSRSMHPTHQVLQDLLDREEKRPRHQ
ncbi:MAG: hypothetical protein LQ338_007728 [Usnochroma carphineum]|nr:MAG: hypothetical protein LQ338_007728 [Usnochroma carphineum]